MNPHEQRAMRLFNLLVFAVFCTLVGYSIYNFLIDEIHLSLAQAILALTLGICPLAVAMGFPFIGKLWWVVASSGVIAIINLVYADSVTTYIFMFPVLAGMIVIFEPTRLKGLLISVILVVLNAAVLILSGHVFTPRQFSAPFIVTKIAEASTSLLIVAVTFLWLLNENKIVEGRLAEERERLRATSNELRNLVRILTHDMANAVMGVQIHATDLSKNNLVSNDINVDTKVRKILRSANLQISLIRTITSLQSLSSGKAKIALKAVEILNIIKQAEETLELNLRDKNLTLVYNAEQLKGVRVIADEALLSHTIVNNLISNAIKFSHKGSTVEIHVEADEQRNTVDLVISDHGIGIPQSLLSHLFSHDRPTSRKGTNGESGTGFGMLLAKETMEKFGGSLRVESKDQAEYPKDSGTMVAVTFLKG